MLYITFLEESFVNQLYSSKGEMNSAESFYATPGAWQKSSYSGNGRNTKYDEVVPTSSRYSININLSRFFFLCMKLFFLYFKQNIRDMDIGGLSRLTEMELIIWMMMHQLMVQDKREILVTMQGKGIPGGQLLSVCASMGIRFLGENHQTRTSWMGRLKVARNKEEGLAKTSKSMLIRPRRSVILMGKLRGQWDWFMQANKFVRIAVMEVGRCI
ncbi:hypothetical protein ZEAMMB73_Zm00001d029424 [Zea mays]|uniref:Uncharacterized protein n=1 Tax=Zea mays TaxID=4577 RepID=A0A1D6K543_MAIZE|nr:hypothetical protein ZEAMMB73_Zm00001d029424 [Zea mays]